MTNQFDPAAHPEVLINIRVGLHVISDVQESLLKVADIGEAQMERFERDALDSDETHCFFRPVKKSGIKTFADIAKKTKFKSGKGGTITAPLSPEIVFHRGLSLSRCRDDVSIRTVLSHPVGPVPMSLFHVDGTMRRTDKAELGHQLEAQAERIHELRACNKETTVYIKDALTVTQVVSGDKFHTFSELAAEYLRKILKRFDKPKSVIKYIDRYDNHNPVKTAERQHQTGFLSISSLVFLPKPKLVNNEAIISTVLNQSIKRNGVQLDDCGS
ncbi:hypothetical protein UY3_04472 [Chelonia mydas]|uniref:Uncharacterized protein n=1 Tax=Chelonia mydas TaxID=8469 RepID=M7C1K1_CHEMY|nr:hypothetical protein UY3_04472 [Chelonia mydas]